MKLTGIRICKGSGNAAEHGRRKYLTRVKYFGKNWKISRNSGYYDL